MSLTQQKQLKLLEKHHEPLSGPLSGLPVRQSSELLHRQQTLLPGLLLELNVQQSSELLNRQLTLLPGLLLEQLYMQQSRQGSPHPAMIPSSTQVASPPCCKADKYWHVSQSPHLSFCA